MKSTSEAPNWSTVRPRFCGVIVQVTPPDVWPISTLSNLTWAGPATMLSTSGLANCLLRLYDGDTAADQIRGVPMGVEYRSCDEFPGYFVGSDGSVWSERKSGPGQTERLKSRIRLKTPLDNCGYPHVHLSGNSGKTRRVAYLVCVAFHGRRPRGQEVRHKDGDRQNSAASNLCWGTRKENVRDSLTHGTHTRGERNGGAKLTQKQADAIICRYSTGGISQYKLAANYGVSRRTIQNIIQGRRYASLRRAD
jgi:hypothetical protein